MPYTAMVELMQQTIVNILQKTYNISYSDAYGIWSKAQVVKDQRVWNIIEGLIKDNHRGVPIIINRNPTMKRNFGDIVTKTWLVLVTMQENLLNCWEALKSI